MKQVWERHRDRSGRERERGKGKRQSGRSVRDRSERKEETGEGTTSELPLIGITNFWNYQSL